MSLLDIISDRNVWIRFYDRRVEQGHLCRGEEYDLYQFIRKGGYQPLLDSIKNGVPFSHPHKKMVAKGHTGKKRTVYTFGKEENHILKLITYLMIKKYDHLFQPSLYSFRSGHSVSEAIRKITRTRDIRQYYSYKVDISNYFNSINVDKLIVMLEENLADDKALLCFLSGMLRNPYAIENGETISESKGAMAGTPTAVFFANLYLNDLDKRFADSKIMYFRYSDDIIIFAKSKEDIERGREIILEHIKEMDLIVNPEKETFSKPGESWSFLGFEYENGEIDISSISIGKIKAKMRRKARALLRWKKAKGKTGPMAAKGFIKAFNRKFYDTDNAHEMNWTRWYFPTITTDKGLKEIDQYMQACIRYIMTGKHNKANYNLRYEQMKEFGYVSLVNNWYKGRKEKARNTFR